MPSLPLWSAVVVLVGAAAHYALIAVGSELSAIGVFALSFIFSGAVMTPPAPKSKIGVAIVVTLFGAVVLVLGDVLFGFGGGYGAKWPGPLNSIVAGMITVPVGFALVLIGALAGAGFARRSTDA